MEVHDNILISMILLSFKLLFYCKSQMIPDCREFSFLLEVVERKGNVGFISQIFFHIQVEISVCYITEYAEQTQIYTSSKPCT